MQDTLKLVAEGRSEILVATYWATKLYNLKVLKEVAWLC